MTSDVVLFFIAPQHHAVAQESLLPVKDIRSIFVSRSPLKEGSSGTFGPNWGLTAVFAVNRNQGLNSVSKSAVALREARMGDNPAPVRPHELLDRIVASHAGTMSPNGEPEVRRYPGYVRIAVPLIGSGLLWAAIIWGARTFF
jgi:hypothetical protein